MTKKTDRETGTFSFDFLRLFSRLDHICSFTVDELRGQLTWSSGVQDGEGVDPDGGGVEEGQRPQAVRD